MPQSKQGAGRTQGGPRSARLLLSRAASSRWRCTPRGPGPPAHAPEEGPEALASREVGFRGRRAAAVANANDDTPARRGPLSEARGIWRHRTMENKVLLPAWPEFALLAIDSGAFTGRMSSCEISGPCHDSDSLSVNQSALTLPPRLGSLLRLLGDQLYLCSLKINLSIS